MKYLIPLVFLVAMASPVKAEYNCGTLAEYYLDYSKPEGTQGRSWFREGYYMGFVWGYVNGDHVLNDRVPQGVSAGQLSHVVGKWLRANPEHWHRSQYYCVERAVMETWPAD